MVKRTVFSCAVGLTVAFGLSAAALAERDLEVTVNVSPAHTAAPGDIALPAEAAPEAHENAAFGLETANRARQLRRELGEQFGQDVAAAARERAGNRVPNIVPPGRP